MTAKESPDRGGAFFSEEELALLQNRSVFHARARMVERMKKSFLELKDRLSMHLGDGNYLMPEGMDLSQSRVGRGEYLEEMPFVYLDYPRHFEGESVFTYRSLFWWGHGVSFSLLLAGRYLQEYRQRLVKNLGILEVLDVHVATADSPWDWSRGPGHTMRLEAGEERTLLRLFRAQEFLKCSRFLDFDQAEFRHNRIDEAALLTFRALEPIILP